MSEANLAVEPVVTETPAANDAAAKVSEPSKDQKQTDAPAEAEQAKKPELSEADKIKMAMQKRIDKLTAKSTQAERAYQDAMAKLQEKEQSKSGEPKESDFDTIEDFLIAKGEYKAKTEYEQKQKSEQEKLGNLRHQERIEKLRVNFDAKEAEMRKTTPDYDQTVQVVNELMDDVTDKNSAEFGAFREMLLTAPDMPALVYHFGKNPELVDGLFKMSPAEIAWTIAREAVKLEGAPKKQSTPNPEPPKAVTGNAKGEKPMSQWTAKEIDAWRKS